MSFLHFFFYSGDGLQQAHAFPEYLSGGCSVSYPQSVLAPYLERGEAKFFRQDVHLALHREGRLRHAEASEGAGGNVVGVGGVAVYLDVGHIVGAGGVGSRAGHHMLAQAGVGPGIAVDLGLDCGERAIAGGSCLQTNGGGVALGVDDQRFLTGEDQLDRAAGGLGQERRVDLDGDVLLAAKSPTYLSGFHPHSLLRNGKAGRDLATVGEGDLGAHVDSDLALLVNRSHPRFGLQKGMVQAGRSILPLHDDVRLGEALFCVAFAHLDVLEEVAAIVDQRSIVGQSLLRRSHHRQRLIFYLD